MVAQACIICLGGGGGGGIWEHIPFTASCPPPAQQSRKNHGTMCCTASLGRGLVCRCDEGCRRCREVRDVAESLQWGAVMLRLLMGGDGPTEDKVEASR
jgi:hypothetical protein